MIAFFYLDFFIYDVSNDEFQPLTMIDLMSQHLHFKVFIFKIMCKINRLIIVKTMNALKEFNTPHHDLVQN